jgi:hypothetical protein
MTSKLKFLFTLNDRVKRKEYFLYGCSLMFLKYLGELVIYYFATSKFLPLTQFLMPFFSLRYPELKLTPDWFMFSIILWSIPFIWIGASMSIRRAVDAHFLPTVAFLFFFPGLNYLMMLFLSIYPSSPEATWEKDMLEINEPKKRAALIFALATAIIGVTLVWFSTNALKVYTTALFLWSPLLLGLIEGYYLKTKFNLSLVETNRCIAITVMFIGLFLVIFALEGLICIGMAIPLVLAMSILGSSLIYITLKHTKSSPPLMFAFMLPILPILETNILNTPHEDVVLSTIEINANPQVIWQNVVEFSELPQPEDALFKLGVAYPKRARIEGRGVGAIRYCEFSTGAFVEPITVWNEPNHLAFDVRYQPQPMKELSFYDTVDAPHLDGYFKSVRGEFRLIPLAEGKTRLEGRTWYQMQIHPGWYWQNYSRFFIHRIHGRVLSHIKNLSEAKNIVHMQNTQAN